MAAHKKETLGQDSEGRYRRYIGWKAGNNKLVQHLFRLGRDEKQARDANWRLEQLWDRVVERWKRLRRENKTTDPSPMWDDQTLVIGQAIARGEKVCRLTPPAGMEALPVDAQIAWLTQMISDFPVIPLLLAGDQLKKSFESTFESIQETTRKMGRDAAIILDGMALALQNMRERGEPVPDCLVGDLREVAQDFRDGRLDQEDSPDEEIPGDGKRLHEALDAYSTFIAQKYKDRPSNRPQQMAIGLLKKHTPDEPLAGMDADRIETWLAYWCRRPNGESGQPIAFTTTRNVLIALRQFLRWLNRSPAFTWSLPSAFAFPRCKISKTPADRVKKRRHFTLDELKTIWEYAKPWERALVLLSLNCGFCKREIATLQTGEVIEGQKHTYIKRHRTKTDVYAEWVLWPETLEALEYLKQFRQTGGGPYVVVNRAGNPLTNGTRTGNENQVIKNHWDNLFKRIHKDKPDFYKLPFKHMRKTGSQLIRRMNADNAAELSSMYLSHGEQSDSEDKLLPDYTDRHWKKLHKALLRLRNKLLPVFTSVKEPWEYRMATITPATRKRVKALRLEGKAYKAIAEEVGIHEMTVGKICRDD